MNEISENGSVVVRQANGDDWPEIIEANARAFGFGHTEQDLAEWKSKLALPDILVAEATGDGDGSPFIVGTSLFYRLSMTVPGGGRIPAAGGGQIMVATTHRRQGIFRRMFTATLQDAERGGCDVLIGMPSEGGIYGRFGLGPASYSRKLRVDLARASLRKPRPYPLPVRELGAAKARDAVARLYERWQARTVGAVHRDRAWWDAEHARKGRETRYLVHEDGYAAYVVEKDRNKLRASVRDFFSTTAEAHTALLQALLGLDSFDHLELEVALDDPLQLKLADQRAASVVEQSDQLWLRILNVPRALAARRYGTEIDVVLRIEDPVLDAGGTFELIAGPEKAECRATDADPDITMELGDLGSLYLGAHSASQLARADRLSARSAEVLKRLDGAMAVDEQPFSGFRW